MYAFEVEGRLIADLSFQAFSEGHDSLHRSP